MKQEQFKYNPHFLNEDEEKEESPKSDLGMFNKKLEALFFEKRSIYF